MLTLWLPGSTSGDHAERLEHARWHVLEAVLAEQQCHHHVLAFDQVLHDQLRPTRWNGAGSASKADQAHRGALIVLEGCRELGQADAVVDAQELRVALHVAVIVERDRDSASRDLVGRAVPVIRDSDVEAGQPISPRGGGGGNGRRWWRRVVARATTDTRRRRQRQ